MPIIVNGKSIAPVSDNGRRDTKIKRFSISAKSIGTSKPYRSKHLNLRVCDGRGRRLHTGVKGKKIELTLKNLAVIQDRFGLNISESVFVALQLTAETIRKGGMRVKG